MSHSETSVSKNEKNFTIGVGINSWDDPQGLLELLTIDENTYNIIDVFYVIEGRYAGREDTPQFDTSIIEGICKKFPKVHYEYKYGIKQIDKRNRYFELSDSDNLDWLIVCDTDEYFVIQPETFIDSVSDLSNFPDLHCFPIDEDNMGHPMPRPRLFRNPGNLRYKQTDKQDSISHGSVWLDKGKGRDVIHDIYKYIKHRKEKLGIKSHTPQVSVQGIRMWHDKKNRSRDRSIADEVYYHQVRDR